ncbi:DeoR/GlpR family DNA-binding transcription regulator [Clostridium manihotivorum]|uniref:DeoR family transcriptional regulator n=1 Tax=Clostridium manihotivorum TaxID=2320868 RepID=A0A410DMC9_9CLOT|nr:DeoR/GlpR family DNA-binding transcription regulator [Clostridium manihotivorum]QAA30227.1 DeoR family transcriptional regulator [Clostridium manihotivorum]
MFAEERQQKILDILNSKSSIKVMDIAELLNVSESTIRRDLQELEEKNLLMRTHGGAVGIYNRTNFEPSFVDKQDEKIDQKISIAEVASMMIEDGDTIILDSGTTTLEIAKRIRSRNITVITNSIDIASELSNKEGIEIIVTGGSLRSNTRAMVGHLTEAVIKNFRVDKAFVGANGISIEDGVTTPNFIEAQTKKTMINYASKVIIVADSTKFNNVSFSIICPIKAVSMIITSRDIEQNIIKEYSEVGVDIVTA